MVMKTKSLLIVVASVTALITGCGSLDTGAVANAGLAAASASKGGSKAGAAVAAGTVGMSAASAMMNSRAEAQPSASNAQAANNTAKSVEPQPKAVISPVPKQEPKPEPPKPKYTVGQYRALFAKRTIEQIANDIITVGKMKNEGRHSFDNMCAAVDWRNGFEVLRALKKDSGNTYWIAQRNIQIAIYTTLDKITDQGQLREAISKLPIKLHDRFKDGSEFTSFNVSGNPYEGKGPEAYYSRAIELITDPAVADYMLSRNLYLGFAVCDLVPKLSQKKKDELYAAAMKRAAERKDRIVVEGFYVGMPYLDFQVVRHHNGFDKTLKDGSVMAGGRIEEREYEKNDFNEEKKLPSEAEMVRIFFTNKAWVKFLDCEDKDVLRQFIHQYVHKKPGKASNYDYLNDIKVEVVQPFREVGHTYSSTKLGTKVAFFPKGGSLWLLEH